MFEIKRTPFRDAVVSIGSVALAVAVTVPFLDNHSHDSETENKKSVCVIDKVNERSDCNNVNLLCKSWADGEAKSEEFLPSGIGNVLICGKDTSIFTVNVWK